MHAKIILSECACFGTQYIYVMSLQNTCNYYLFTKKRCCFLKKNNQDTKYVFKSLTYITYTLITLSFVPYMISTNKSQNKFFYCKNVQGSKC